MSNANQNDNAAVFARIAELEAMQAELKALKAKTANMPRMKVSQKGAISIYGLQRMPVTLYAGQWERIIQLVESGVFADFIAQNEKTLTRKDESKPAPTVQPVAMGKAAKSKTTKKTKNGPTKAELAAIEAERAALGFDID